MLGVAGAVMANQAQAGDLENFITDLYGGDGITLRQTPSLPFQHSAHFTQESLEQLSGLNSGITTGLNRQVSSTSSVSSFTFDVENAVLVRTTQSLGPILAERAETIGEGKVNFGVNYTEAKFKRYQGARLDQLAINFPHTDDLPGGVIGFERESILVTIDATVEQRVTAFYATLGLTPRWDVGMIVPVVVTKAKASSVATIQRVGGVPLGAHTFNGTTEDCRVLDPTPGLGNQCASSSGGQQGGVGDLFFRTKYNFLRGDEQIVDFSVLGQLAVPTGDDDNLLGTGQWRPLVLLILSKDFGPVTPHVNVGYEMPSTSSKWFNVPYAVGLDVRVIEQLTLALDVLGRRGTYDNVKGSHQIEWAVGAKVNPWKTLTLIGNARFPVNNGAGLTANVIWTAGVEYTF